MASQDERQMKAGAARSEIGKTADRVREEMGFDWGEIACLLMDTAQTYVELERRYGDRKEPTG